MCPGAFLKVLEQDTVSVEEIDLWRAALKWARQKGSFLLFANTHRKPLLKISLKNPSPEPFQNSSSLPLCTYGTICLRSLINGLLLKLKLYPHFLLTQIKLWFLKVASLFLLPLMIHRVCNCKLISPALEITWLFKTLLHFLSLSRYIVK